MLYLICKILVQKLKISLITALLVSFSGVAQEADIFDLDISQLAKVKVSLATKTSETRATVPSTITTFNQAEIARLGIANAYDLLNFVPGFQMTRGDWVGAVPKEHARGVYLDNGYILVMIDGQPLNDVSFGKASVYSPFIPTSIIEKVEIIRGPGSALYGSYAFLGVLNVTTKKKSKSVKLSVGENNLLHLSGSWHQDLNEKMHLYANVSVEASDGNQYESPLKRVVSDPYKNQFFELGLHADSMSVSFKHNTNQLDEFMNLGGYSVDNKHESITQMFAFNSTLYDGEVHQLNTTLSYASFEIASAGMVLPSDVGITAQDFLVGPYWQTQTTTFKLDHAWQTDQQLSINSGFEFVHTGQYQAGVYTTHYNRELERVLPSDESYLGNIVKLKNIPEYDGLRESREVYSMYSQVKWLYSDVLTVFLGARYDDVKGIDSKLSPRVAFVWQTNPAHSLKLQYGESFRTPVNNELYSNDDVTTGNSNLVSEFVKTTELVWLYQKEQLSTEVVLFNNQLRDFINKVPFSGNAIFTFSNEIDKNISGLESSVSTTLNERTKITVNYTHLFDDPINASYKKFATLALDYNVEDWQANVNLIWRDSVDSTLENGATFNQGDYFLLGLSTSYRLSEKQRISLSAINLANQKYHVFDPRVATGEVPGQGRQVRLNFYVVF